MLRSMRFSLLDPWPRSPLFSSIGLGGILLVLPGQAGAVTAPQPLPAPSTPSGVRVSAGPTTLPATLEPTTTSSTVALTAERVGVRALETSYSAKAASEALRAAAARVDQAWANFLPRLSGTARYARLSNLTPSSLGSSNANLVATTDPAGTINPKATISAPFSFSFPIVLDNYSLQASIVVPISDYFLRIAQAHTAASSGRDAASFDLAAVRAKAYTEGKVAYFTWLRAKGAIGVATQALEDQRAHLKDAQSLFAVGKTFKADVLRAETGVAAAELSLERTKFLDRLVEKQIRLATHLGDSVSLTAGESLDGPLPAFTGNVRALVVEGHSNRPELKSLEANLRATRQLVSIAKAGRYPQIAAFGNAYYQNPNQRKFPQQSEWFGTWDVGAQISWSPQELVVSFSATAEAEAKVASLEANRSLMMDGIELEITQAYQAVREADLALEATKKMVQAAEEGFRVARELFKAGTVSSTLVTDAETDLTKARLEQLNARVDQRISRAKLALATGRALPTSGR